MSCKKCKDAETKRLEFENGELRKLIQLALDTLNGANGISWKNFVAMARQALGKVE